MQKLFFRLFTLMIFVSLSCVESYSATPKGAIIEVKESSHNFGRVSRHSDNLSHTFKLYNHGTSPLVITDVTTTCTCLKAKYSKRPLMPKDSMEMKIIYDIKRKEVGTFSKIVKIYSNATNAPFEVITINGESVE
ncbi:MAG: DUF1573 domain-containing protein [Rikenellaceae bacterium]